MNCSRSRCLHHTANHESGPCSFPGCECTGFMSDPVAEREKARAEVLKLAREWLRHNVVRNKLESALEAWVKSEDSLADHEGRP